MEEQMFRLAENDAMAAIERQFAMAADRGEQTFNCRGVDSVGCLSGETKQDCTICAVAKAGQRERAVEFNADAGCAIELVCSSELARESKSGAHGADRVRA